MTELSNLQDQIARLVLRFFDLHDADQTVRSARREDGAINDDQHAVVCGIGVIGGHHLKTGPYDTS